MSPLAYLILPSPAAWAGSEAAPCLPGTTEAQPGDPQAPLWLYSSTRPASCRHAKLSSRGCTICLCPTILQPSAQEPLYPDFGGFFWGGHSWWAALSGAPLKGRPSSRFGIERMLTLGTSVHLTLPLPPPPDTCRLHIPWPGRLRGGVVTASQVGRVSLWGKLCVPK